MRAVYRVVCVVSLVVLTVLPSHAQVPALINYQGRLTDGTNLVSGSFPIAFSIHTNETGNTPLFVCTNTIVVTDGLYSTYIGEYPLTGTLTNALRYDPLYLQVEINAVNLSPRERLVSVFFAQMAAAVPNGAITTDMLDYQCVDADRIRDEVITIDQMQDDAIDGNKIVNGSVGPEDLAAGVSSVYVARAGSTMTGQLNLPQGGLLVGSEQLVLTNGYIGMGESDPSEHLHLRGDTPNLRIDNYTESAFGIQLTDSQIPGSQFAAINYDAANEDIRIYLNSTSAPVLHITADHRAAFNGQIAIGPTSTQHLVIYTNQSVLYGDGAGWYPNTSGVQRGYAGSIIQDVSVASDTAGIYMDPDMMALWSPGDIDLLRVYDEDDLDEASPQPKFVIDTAGNVGIRTNNPAAALDVVGDLKVSGAFKGDLGSGGAPFPRPAYDSGWVDQPYGTANNYNHNLGGDVDDYFVDIQSRYSTETAVYPGANTFYERSDGTEKGFTCYVTTNYWRVMHFEDGTDGPTNFRCRIWIVQ